MNSLQKILKILSSLKITVACLLILFVLTFLGTIAQVEQGLYLAQEKYFNSLFFLMGGFIPFVGARFVLWILFINLTAVTVTRFVKYRNWRYVGILITHFGLLLYFVSAFVVFHGSQESQVTVLEKQGTNVSTSYHQWELSIWKDTAYPRDVVGYRTAGLKSGDQIVIDQLNLSFLVTAYYPNADAFLAKKEDDLPHLNSSNISIFQPRREEKEREENRAAIVLELLPDYKRVLLYGADPQPTQLTVNGETWFLQLRKQKFELPFSIFLKDFRAKFHPGTEVARSYESDVIINHKGVEREVNISMNEPFRFKDYTAFQAAYLIDDDGNEFSTFAIVKNKGRLLPYVASLLTFFGLFVHLIIQLGLRKK